MEPNHKVLTLLAKRYNSDYDNLIIEVGDDLVEGWFYNHDDYDYCLICGENMSLQNTYEHGNNHLKERNLLPFL